MPVTNTSTTTGRRPCVRLLCRRDVHTTHATMHQVERQRVRPEFEGNHLKIIIIIDIPGSVLLCPGNLKEKRWGVRGRCGCWKCYCMCLWILPVVSLGFYDRPATANGRTIISENRAPFKHSAYGAKDTAATIALQRPPPPGLQFRSIFIRKSILNILLLFRPQRRNIV